MKAQETGNFPFTYSASINIFFDKAEPPPLCPPLVGSTVTPYGHITAKTIASLTQRQQIFITSLRYTYTYEALVIQLKSRNKIVQSVKQAI